MSESEGRMTAEVSAAMLEACHEAFGPPRDENLHLIGAFVLGYEAATKRLTRERDRYRAALEEIAAGGCRTQHLNIDPVCRPPIPREEWCEGCIAAEALEAKP